LGIIRNNAPKDEPSDGRFAKGMVSWEKHDNDSMSNYTIWQAAIIAPYISKKVIEIGAGQGRIASILSKNIKCESYYAQEPSPSFYLELKKELKNAETSNVPLEELPSSLRNSFDTVVSVHVLEHIEDDKGFLEDMSKLLKSGGTMVILVPALQFLYSELDRNIGHFRRYNKKMFREIAKELNFDVVACHYSNFAGIFGWLWFCKIRRYHYQTNKKKTKFIGILNIFDKYVLRLVSFIEKIIHPPIGLNLLVVLRPREKMKNELK